MCQGLWRRTLYFQHLTVKDPNKPAGRKVKMPDTTTTDLELGPLEFNPSSRHSSSDPPPPYSPRVRKPADAPPSYLSTLLADLKKFAATILLSIGFTINIILTIWIPYNYSSLSQAGIGAVVMACLMLPCWALTLWLIGPIRAEDFERVRR